MKADEINDWLGVITNIGVIGGLVLVAYEINQTTISMDREYRSWITTVSQQNQQMWIDWAASIADTETSSIWYRGATGAQLEPHEDELFFRLSTAYFWLYFNMYGSFETIQSGTATDIPKSMSVEFQTRPGLASAFRNWCDLHQTGPFCEKVLGNLR